MFLRYRGKLLAYQFFGESNSVIVKKIAVCAAFSVPLGAKLFVSKLLDICDVVDP